MQVRTLIWLVLLAGAGLCVILALTSGSSPAIIWAIVVAWAWVLICYGVGSNWYWGIRRHVVAHLGRRWELGEVLRHPVRSAERVNIQVALDWLANQSNSRGPFGITDHGFDEEGEVVPYGRVDIVTIIGANPEPRAINWERFSISPTETMNCAGNALYLLRVLDHPVAVLIQSRPSKGSRRATLHLLARTQDIAQASLNEILRLAREQSVYRGQILSVEQVRNNPNDLNVHFHDLPRVRREEIILPESVLQAIDRNLLGIFRHAEALRKAGRETRQGVLLHGPPGTGKTLVSRYVAAHAGGTIFLVSGRGFAQLRPTCHLARLLAPSLIILEDVDLIATDRRRNRYTSILHDLLDEMDGLSGATDVVFLLTTNRPESLEAALAGRPGRVGQAIYFPLPDLQCRRRLFQQFSAGLDVRAVDLEPLLCRTEGASPAFLKELFRRASLLAIERGVKGAPLPLTNVDFENALHELISTGGTLTRNFLGFPTTPADQR